ncbi:NADH dehydrogenase (ubiquinone) alpha subcomplex [Salix suchowensis]|nr:NADH dehydrogenase (ubiquinone) alpha subcomplex [Salix suchowensis]
MAWRGHLSKNLKELRILLCQSSPSSSSTRTFIEKNYKDLKTLNPKLPILIRECNGIEPQLWARYGICFPHSHLYFLSSPVTSLFGVERGVRLEGLSEAQISKALEELGKVGASLKG